MRELEIDNARFNRIFADLSLVHHALKHAAEKAVSHEGKWGIVDLMRKEHQISLRQNFKAVNLPRSSYSYQR